MASTLTAELDIDEGLAIADCDLRVAPRDEDELIPYLPERFRSKGVAYPDGNWPSSIDDIQSNADDEAIGVDPVATVDSHLDTLGLEHAVVTGGRINIRSASSPDLRYAAALTRAYNDWLLETWLNVDERIRGSISVAPVTPERAADEIRRLGSREEMVQVIMGGGTQIPFGDERYWPIYEAAVAEDLPVAIRVGAEGHGVSNPNTGAGYPSTPLERHCVAPANVMGQLLNLVLDGAFVEFPDLRIVMVGSGYSWVPSFCWRMDKVWKGVSDDFPWIERPPSEYVREHVRFATYPIDEADDPEQTRRMLEMANAEETVVFGSNYPYWDGYAPGDELPDLPPSMARAIFAETAQELYDL